MLFYFVGELSRREILELRIDFVSKLFDVKFDFFSVEEFIFVLVVRTPN